MTEAELKKHLDLAEKSPKQIAAAVLGLTGQRLCATSLRRTSGASWRFWRIWRILKSVRLSHAADAGGQEPGAWRRLTRTPGRRISGYMESSPPELVALYGLNRHATVQLLRRLKAADLEKSARHPEKDHPVTVADYVQMMAKHGPNHLEQIERLKKAAGKPEPQRTQRYTKGLGKRRYSTRVFRRPLCAA